MTCPPHSLKPTRRSGPSKQFIKRARPAPGLVFLSNHSFPRARLVNAMCPSSTGHQSIFLDEMRYPLTTQQSANCCSQACQFGWPIKLVCLSFPASRSSPVNAQRIDQRSRAGPGFLLTSFSLEPRAVTCHSAHSILLVALFLSSRHQHFFHKKGTNPSSARHPMIGRRVDSFFVVAALLALLVPLSATEPAEPSNEQSPEVEKRMLSYADLMNNFGGPSPLDFFGAPGNSLFMLDEERPKRELEEADDEVLGLWKRSPRGFLNGGQRNYLMKKDEFVAPGVLRFGKRMPGVLRFGKRNPVIHEKKAVPGVLRFGKRDAPEGSVPGVLRFGKRMPQVLRFGRR